MARILIALAIALCMTSLATAQTTWRGLRFGMTEAEARIALNAVRQPSKGGDKPKEPGVSVIVQIETIPGIAILSFDAKTKGLCRIFIQLDPKDLSSDIDKRVSESAIITSLENKYGEPFRTVDNPLTRRITWRPKDQVIVYDAIMLDGLPLLITISYEPLSAIKDL
jgi:hypothetical protein